MDPTPAVGTWTRERHPEEKVISRPGSGERDQHLTTTVEYIVFTTHAGDVYRFARDDNAPMRDDFPKRIEPPPGEDGFPIGPAGLDGRSRLRIAALIWPDGEREFAHFNETHPKPLEPVEVVSLEVEELILSECDHPRYAGLKNPTMREFYTAYVIQRRKQKEIEGLFKCSKRTTINRKELLERDLYTFHKIRWPLRVFRNDRDLKEARDKRARNRLKR
jgi:hypothetical protein